MNDSGTYSCKLMINGQPEPATCVIGRESLGIMAGKLLWSLNYADFLTSACSIITSS